MITLAEIIETIKNSGSDSPSRKMRYYLSDYMLAVNTSYNHGDGLLHEISVDVYPRSNATGKFSRFISLTCSVSQDDEGQDIFRLDKCIFEKLR